MGHNALLIATVHVLTRWGAIPRAWKSRPGAPWAGHSSEGPGASLKESAREDAAPADAERVVAGQAGAADAGGDPPAGGALRERGRRRLRAGVEELVAVGVHQLCAREQRLF